MQKVLVTVAMLVVVACPSWAMAQVPITDAYNPQGALGGFVLTIDDLDQGWTELEGAEMELARPAMTACVSRSFGNVNQRAFSGLAVVGVGINPEYAGLMTVDMLTDAAAGGFASDPGDTYYRVKSLPVGDDSIAFAISTTLAGDSAQGHALGVVQGDVMLIVILVTSDLDADTLGEVMAYTQVMLGRVLAYQYPDDTAVGDSF